MKLRSSCTFVGWSITGTANSSLVGSLCDAAERSAYIVLHRLTSKPSHCSTQCLAYNALYTMYLLWWIQRTPNFTALSLYNSLRQDNKINLRLCARPFGNASCRPIDAVAAFNLIFADLALSSILKRTNRKLH